MDTIGHESHADDVGIPMLKEAFTRAGKHDQLVELLGENYLEVVYLGNWLTDVSQGVDPVAYANAQTKAINAFDGLVATLQAIADRFPLAPGIGVVRDAIEGLKNQHRPRLQALLAMLQGGADSDFGRAITLAMKVKGYFKFSAPEQRGGKLKLKFPVYKAVFQDHFTQYFPHEHLDRFPDALDLHAGYSAKTATRTRTVDGPPGTGSKQKPHIYEYLVEHIEIAAGMVADVDLWAREALAENAVLPSGEDEQKEWGRYLARFGHALHACEDFFAHSNFIEHAYQGRGDAKQALDKLGITKVDDKSSSTPWGAYNKRLNKLTGKRVRTADGGTEWQPDDDWHEVSSPPGPNDETEVVTGTFDFADTLHSLEHVGAELGATKPGEKAGKIAAGHAEKAEKAEKFSNFLGSMCRDVLRLSDERGETNLSEADAKRDAEVLLRRYAKSHPDGDVNEVARDIEGIPAEAAEIRDDALTGIALLTKQGPYGAALFTLLEWYVGQMSWMLGWNAKVQESVDEDAPLLRRALDAIEKWFDEAIGGKIERNISQPLGEAIEKFLGRYRLGCHSLIAKDYEWKRERYDKALDKLYWRNMHCAKAVHWYIVKTLVRWSEPNLVVACRAEHGSDRMACATVDTHRYLDWHELLEFFLRHPHGQPQPGYEAQGEHGRWWWHIIEQSDWKRFPGLPGKFTETKRSPVLPHWPVYYNLGSAQANRAEVEKLRDAGAALRRQAESFYNDSLKQAGGTPPQPSPKQPRVPTDVPAEREDRIAVPSGG